MNKTDLKLIIGLVLLLLISIPFMFTNNSNYITSKQALVYYDNNIILEINLDINDIKEYKVSGLNGDVVIQSQGGRVRVIEEISPLHICSYQGWIQLPNQVIVCLPNKIVIKIVDKNDILDVIIR